MSRQTLMKGFIIIAIIGGGAIVYALWKQDLPLWAAYLLAIGIITFLSYGLDKLQAKTNHTRIPEATLHLFALIGGTPGAFLGQAVFHHKTSKQSFRRVFWGIVVLQVIALGVYLYLRNRTSS